MAENHARRPLKHFSDKLRKRLVVRTALLYLAIAWVVVEVVATVVPELGLAGWLTRAVIAVAAAGFPLALLLAWMLDLRESGQRGGLVALVAVVVLLAVAASLYMVRRGGDASPSGDDRWALVVGIDRSAEPSLTPLRYGVRDAVAFHDFLTSPAAGRGGIPPGQVTLLTGPSATYARIRRELFRLLDRDSGLVILYFATHGLRDERDPDRYYFLTYDTNLQNVPGTAFPADEVGYALQRGDSLRVVWIGDTGPRLAVPGPPEALRSLPRAAPDTGVERIYEELLDEAVPGFVTLTPAEMDQSPREGAHWGGGHGEFTFRLLEGLRGAADQDGDRVVTLGELIEYARGRVRRANDNQVVPTISLTRFDRSLPMGIVLPGR